MHARPEYANRVIGRSFEYGDGSVVLQYWFWYYYNPKTYLTRGAHEGDWEMVQVHLDSSLNPVKVTASQHTGGERCNWVNVQRNALDRPIIYVAEGSHASYFSSGYHFNDGANDTSGGDGERVLRSALIDVTVPTNWIMWPGHWGGTPDVTLGSGSPSGPRQQGGNKWNNPEAWSNEVDGCTEEQVQSASRRAKARRGKPSVNRSVPVPRVRVRRDGGSAVISYDFVGAAAAKWRHPLVLLTSVGSSGRRVPPITNRTEVRRLRGQVRQPIGRGKAPFVLRVATETKGGRSRIVTIPLRG
jgi:hypothetical protein